MRMERAFRVIPTAAWSSPFRSKIASKLSRAPSSCNVLESLSIAKQTVLLLFMIYFVTIITAHIQYAATSNRCQFNDAFRRC